MCCHVQLGWNTLAYLSGVFALHQVHSPQSSPPVHPPAVHNQPELMMKESHQGRGNQSGSLETDWSGGLGKIRPLLLSPQPFLYTHIYPRSGDVYCPHQLRPWIFYPSPFSVFCFHSYVAQFRTLCVNSEASLRNSCYYRRKTQ